MKRHNPSDFDGFEKKPESEWTERDRMLLEHYGVIPLTEAGEKVYKEHIENSPKLQHFRWVLDCTVSKTKGREGRGDVLEIDKHGFRADEIPVMGDTKLLLIQGSRGMLGCGYVSLGAAEKFGHALAIVKGVTFYGDMLAAKVCEVSPAAAALGVKPGMTGREALLLMA